MISLDGYNLSLDEFEQIVFHNEPVQLADHAIEKVQKANDFISDIINSDRIIYGINTGFGNFKDTIISKEDIETLQENLIRSHACGVGEPLSYMQARAVILLRLNCLLRGNSGISVNIVKILAKLINNNIYPYIPKKGSVGASGDLAPLAHLALILIGDGEVIDENGNRQDSAPYLKQRNINTVSLGPKEGLALINGTPVMTAIAGIEMIRIRNIIIHSDLALAMSLEGFKGSLRAFDDKIHKLKNSLGQRNTASNINTLCQESNIIKSHKDCKRVQDPYSFRCAPHVHGSVRDAYHYTKGIIENEFNSVTDNPLIFVQEEEVISGGNFHGAAISHVMDFMAIVLTDLGSISERRIEVLTRGKEAGLPPFLIREGGLNSGFMIPQVTSAALVSYNKTLSHPASVDSISTSAGQEDHVSMGTNSAIKLKEIVDNMHFIIGIELISGMQAIYLQKPLSPGKGTSTAYEIISRRINPYDKDRVFYKDFEIIKEIIESKAIIEELNKNRIFIEV